MKLFLISTLNWIWSTYIVTGEETWISYKMLETKCRIKGIAPFQITNTTEENKNSEHMESDDVLNHKCVLLIDFIPTGLTIYKLRGLRSRRSTSPNTPYKTNAAVYCPVVSSLFTITLNHNCNNSKLQHFGYNVFQHPPYTTDVALSNFHVP